MADTDLLERPAVDETIDDGLLHGVHLKCQPEEPYTAQCGRMLFEFEREEASDREECPQCWKTGICPVCGALLFGVRRG